MALLNRAKLLTSLKTVPINGAVAESVRTFIDQLEAELAAAGGGGGASRIVTILADATSITPQATGDSNINIQNNTQSAGTLTVNAPSATAEARGLVLRIKCTNAQTLSFNSIYRAPSLLPLPTNIGAGKTVYAAFAFNNTDSKWDLTAVMKDYA